MKNKGRDASNEVRLCASTSMHGSECSFETGYTVEEWNEMTEDEKTDVVNEMMANVVNIWTESPDGNIIE